MISCVVHVESSDSASQANTVEMVNTPIFIDDTLYDQRGSDDVDDYKPPYNVSTRIPVTCRWTALLLVISGVFCIAAYLLYVPDQHSWPS